MKKENTEELKNQYVTPNANMHTLEIEESILSTTGDNDQIIEE